MYIFISVFTTESLCLSVVQILIHGFPEVELISLGPQKQCITDDSRFRLLLEGMFVKIISVWSLQRLVLRPGLHSSG